jgi:hypothetical protein
MAVGGTHVKWFGDLIAEKTIAACAVAIDEVTKAAADDAQKDHWWSSRSGSLQRNTFSEPAKLTPEGTVSGRFGSSLRREGFYGLFLERKEPWLRPAADRNFKNLKHVLRGRTRWT